MIFDRVNVSIIDITKTKIEPVSRKYANISDIACFDNFIIGLINGKLVSVLDNKYLDTETVPVQIAGSYVDDTLFGLVYDKDKKIGIQEYRISKNGYNVWAKHLETHIIDRYGNGSMTYFLSTGDNFVLTTPDKICVFEKNKEGKRKLRYLYHYSTDDELLDNNNGFSTYLHDDVTFLFGTKYNMYHYTTIKQLDHKMNKNPNLCVLDLLRSNNILSPIKIQDISKTIEEKGPVYGLVVDFDVMKQYEEVMEMALNPIEEK